MSVHVSPTPAALELDSVTTGYGSTIVLHDVSIRVEPGSVVALLGPNGAGKTTLLRTAAGLLGLSDGRVLADGVDLTARPPSQRMRSGVCLVPEGRGIFPNLSVRENLKLQVPPWIKREGYDRAVDAFPLLGQRLDQRAGSMSGGQQQMLALATCFVSAPKVVLLDEVSMGLAPIIVDEIFEALRKLAATGVSLLLVEQYVARALEMADHVYLLNRGEMAFSGTGSDLDGDELARRYLHVERQAS